MRPTGGSHVNLMSAVDVRNAAGSRSPGEAHRQHDEGGDDADYDMPACKPGVGAELLFQGWSKKKLFRR